LDKISVQGGLMNYELVQTLYKKEKKGTTIWLEMQPSWKENAFGSPQTVYIKYFFPVDNKQIEIEVNWFDKQKNTCTRSGLVLINSSSIKFWTIS